MLYTKHDRDACSKGLRLTIQVPPAILASATVQAAIGGLSTGLSDSVDVQFQFPPKIVSDSRGGEWKESENGTGPTLRDVIVVYRGPKSRKLSLQWLYMVDGGDWTSARIAAQLRLLRGYFVANSFGASGSSIFEPMVVLAKLWDIGGRDQMSFRIQDVNVKHNETLVGVPPNLFPLRSEVSLDLLTWPQISTGGANGPVSFAPSQRVMSVDWF